MKKVASLLCMMALLVLMAGCSGTDEFTAALNKAQFSDQTPEELRDNIVQQIQSICFCKCTWYGIQYKRLSEYR